jgi:ubiquitin carboxyl-terminal hydrolase 4/11/15
MEDQSPSLKKVTNTEEENEESSTIKKERRSKLTLEGGKEPLSMYTRRVINTSKIKDFLKEDSSHGLCGGRNLGNTCFMNSSIACLSNCTELTYYFLSGDYKKDINKENNLGMGGDLANSWGNILNQYWVESTRVGNPADFKRTIGNKVKMFRGFGQQDSNEFMNFVLDYLNEDLNGTTKKPYIEIESKRKDESDESCSKRFWECNLKRNDSVITDLFCGQYKSTIICPDCGNINITFDPFTTLTLPLTNKKCSSNNKNLDLLDEIHLFYVPKYSIRKPVRIVIKNIDKKMTLNEIFKNLGNKRDFIYKEQIDELYFTNISKGKLINFVDDISEIEDHTNDFIFCYDIIEEIDNIKIPLYFKNSQFPRIIYGTNDMTIDELRKKIYFNIRKYIRSPIFSLEEQKDKDTIAQEIQKFMLNMKMDEDKLFELIDEEYKKIFNEKISDENIKKNIEQFILDIPFKIYLQEKKTNKIIPIIDENNFFNISKDLSEFLEINSYEDKFSEKLSLLENYEIYVDFQNKSKYLNNKEMKLNSCLVYKTDYKNIKIEQKRSGKITLDDCLNNFCKEEKLEEGNEWYCPICKKHTLATKKMELYYLPKILIICFKRFIKESFRWRKNEEFIDFPINNLDMKEFIVGPDKPHSKYDLFAVSQHFGSTNFGHYTAVCKNFDKWFSYNDSSIHSCSENDAKSSAAYILFYRRQTD